MYKGVFPTLPQAIVFDLDGTLYHHKPVQRRMMLRLLCHCLTHPTEANKLLRVIRTYRKAQEQLRGYVGSEPIGQKQLEIAATQSGASREEVQPIIAHWMEQLPLSSLLASRYAGLVEFLEKAKTCGIRLAVLSDYPAHQKLEALEIKPYFEAILFAQMPEINVFKPNPKGIELSLQHLNVPKESALYIGDRPEVDGNAAQAAGVPFVLIGNRTLPPDSPPTWHHVPDYPTLTHLLQQ